MSQKVAPEHTAVRVSLWRALHVKLDQQPLVLEDTLGEKIINEENWESRPDMHPMGTRKVRASIVGRARFIEDLVAQEFKKGIRQFVILGAGLDTFAFRHPEYENELSIFEIDQAGPQEWKVKRINEMGMTIPRHLNFVPVDFEKESWILKLKAFNFDFTIPTLIVSTGVTMYLTREANISTLKMLNQFSSGSIFATTYMLPLEELPTDDRALLEFSMKKAAESGTPFISLFNSKMMIELAHDAGLKDAITIHSEEIIDRYFHNRADQLIPAIGECFLIIKI